ncbi:MAG: alcohol dehydrogenase catalytic domain-containing protein [Myxococcota bacterium]|jgi:threonine dehydrogenase-like Zn-dependent dehydrogenase|nr:alcohol dehydrogenase catalytic domain-containing protein [Myxococcota bacterium]
MRAVRCCDTKIQVTDVPEPKGDGVRVHVKSASICGSDLHLLSYGIPLPHTLGHEFAGVLDDGRAVAIEPLRPCGECDLCQSDDYNLCRLGAGIIMGVGSDGGMTDQVIVPERCVVPIPDGLPVRSACLVEPIAIAVHGVRLGGVGEGDRVSIIGGGSIGLAATAACRALGAEVAMHARHPHQVEAARNLGAIGPGGESPFVIDCAGTNESIAQAMELCRPGGRVILLATYWDGMTIPAMVMCLKEIQVIPSSLYNHQHTPSDFEFASDMLARNSDIAEVLVTHRLPLDDAARAFEIAADRKAGAIKVVLEV